MYYSTWSMAYETTCTSILYMQIITNCPLAFCLLIHTKSYHYGIKFLFCAQQDEFHLKWSPDDLTQQDVASLYSAQADSWTLVDEFSTFKCLIVYHIVTVACMKNLCE